MFTQLEQFSLQVKDMHVKQKKWFLAHSLLLTLRDANTGKHLVGMLKRSQQLVKMTK